MVIKCWESISHHTLENIFLCFFEHWLKLERFSPKTLTFSRAVLRHWLFCYAEEMLNTEMSHTAELLINLSFCHEDFIRKDLLSCSNESVLGSLKRDTEKHMKTQLIPERLNAALTASVEKPAVQVFHNLDEDDGLFLSFVWMEIFHECDLRSFPWKSVVWP